MNGTPCSGAWLLEHFSEEKVRLRILVVVSPLASVHMVSNIYKRGTTSDALRRCVIRCVGVPLEWWAG
jgi:hypothetical protein